MPGRPISPPGCLADLAALGRRPVLVVSQPDRPRGRGRKATAPPAVLEADRLGLECLQAEDINDPAVAARLRATGVSTLVVAAFGQILKLPLLESFLCLNVHASLLPAYRGAAPIERALAAGESCTGVSIMRMTEGLDEGPWALQTSVSVGLRDDAGSIGRVLALLGATGIDQVLTGLAEGTVGWTEQQGHGHLRGQAVRRRLLARSGEGGRGRPRPGAVPESRHRGLDEQAERSNSRCGAPGPTDSPVWSRCPKKEPAFPDVPGKCR